MSTTEQDSTIITDVISDHLGRFMAFQDADQPLALSLWVLHTHTFSDSFPNGPWTTPYLYIHSSESRSGKTTLIDLLEPLVFNAERAIDMSSATMWRVIETMNPTLFIDEVDAIWSGAKNEGLRSVINGGYKRGGYAWRTVNGEPTKFNSFGPKLLAGIDNGHLPETVESRCIPIELRRAPEGIERETYYSFMAGPEAELIRDQITAWLDEYRENIDCQRYVPAIIPGINPRAFEIVMPLLQIAKAIGIEDQAREAFTRMLSPKAPKDTPEVAALRVIRDLFESEQADKLSSATICKALGEGWNGKLLGTRITAPMSVGSPTTFPINGKQAKGYYKWQFEPAFAKHLS